MLTKMIFLSFVLLILLLCECVHFSLVLPLCTLAGSEEACLRSNPVFSDNMQENGKICSSLKFDYVGSRTRRKYQSYLC